MTAFYRLLLRLYPSSYRMEYQAELMRTYEELVRDNGAVGAVLAAVSDVVPNAVLMHWNILAQDLRYTARTLGRSRGFAVATILVTALGVGANTATFSMADYVLVRPLEFREPDRLVRVCDGPREGGGWGCMNQMVVPRYRDLVEMNRSFESVGAFARRAVNIVGRGDPVRVASTAVTPEALPVLGVRPWMGRLFDVANPQADARSVVISYGLWQSQFGGDAGIIGAALNLDGTPYTVIGVMPSHFRFPTSTVALWTPLVFGPTEYNDTNNNYLELIARLKPGVTFEQARTDLNNIADQLITKYPANQDRGFSFFKQRDEMAPGYRVMLLALCGASLCMLLLTCANLANLLLARAAGRERELAVRAALGAGRERLVRQMLTETVVLALVGGLAGAAAAAIVLPLLWQLVPNSMPMATQPHLDLRAFGIAMALSTLTGLGFGLWPALRLGGSSGFLALREGARGSASRKGLRSLLVAIEVSVSVVLLIGSGLLIRAMVRVQSVDTGFTPGGAVAAQTALPSPRYDDYARRIDFYDRVLANVRSLPGVEAAGYVSGRPFIMRGGIAPVLLPGEQNKRDGSQNVAFRVITPQFFAAIGIPFRQGRDVSESDTPAGQLVAVVSESFAKKRLNGQNPIGQTIEVNSQRRIIVGVVGDVKQRGLESRASEPQLYVPMTQAPDGLGDNYLPNDIFVRARLTDAALIANIRRAVQQVDPQQPVSNVMTLERLVEDQSGTRRAQVRVLGALAALALILAVVGIHGLLSFTVAQRDREIGVRLALGADPAHVGRMVIGEGMRMAVFGVVPGVFLAYLGARAMSSLLFGVKPEDPVTIGGVALLCFVATVGACISPARRASRIHPMSALRSD